MAAGGNCATDHHPRTGHDPVALARRRSCRPARRGDETPGAGDGPCTLADFEEPGELLESGVVARLHDEVYARLAHGRLVLLGGPGAGKTGAMILLLLAGLEMRASLGGEHRRPSGISSRPSRNKATRPPRRWMLRMTRGLAVGLPVGAAAAFAASHLIGLVVGHVHGPVAPITVGMVGMVGAGIGSDRAGGGYKHTPRTLIPRWPRTREFVWILRNGQQVGLAIALGVGLAGALAAGFASGSIARAGSGFAVGFVVGFVFGAVVGLFLALSSVWATPIADSPSASPATTYRADLRAGAVAGLMIGLVGGVAVGLAAGLKFGPAFGFEAAIVFGVCAGLPVWMLTAQVPLVKLTELVLACQRSGRVHFLHLLDEALNRQVLRQAGAVYQFRHAALQDRLAETYSRLPTRAGERDLLPGRNPEGLSAREIS